MPVLVLLRSSGSYEREVAAQRISYDRIAVQTILGVKIMRAEATSPPLTSSPTAWPKRVWRPFPAQLLVSAPVTFGPESRLCELTVTCPVNRDIRCTRRMERARSSGFALSGWAYSPISCYRSGGRCSQPYRDWLRQLVDRLPQRLVLASGCGAGALPANCMQSDSSQGPIYLLNIKPPHPAGRVFHRRCTHNH
jgi:hypothetical protein